MLRVVIDTPKSAVWERLRIGAPGALDSAMRRYAFDAAAVTHEAIIAKLTAPRLALLMRSWRIAQPTKEDGHWTSYVYSDHPRAAFRETGGTVRAGKNAAKCGPNAGQLTKALAIPTDAAKTSTMSKQPCDIPGLRWFPNKAGKRGGNNRGVLATAMETMTTRGKNKGKAVGSIREVFFILLWSITAPPTPYYGPALRETEQKRIDMFEFYARQALLGTA